MAVHNLGGGAVLQHVAFHAEVQRAIEGILFLVHGEKDDRHRQFQLTNRSRERKAVLLRHADVQNSDVRLERLNALQRGSPIGRFANQHQIRIVFDDFTQTFAEDRVIVGDDDSDLGCHSVHHAPPGIGSVTAT